MSSFVGYQLMPQQALQHMVDHPELARLCGVQLTRAGLFDLANLDPAEFGENAVMEAGEMLAALLAQDPSLKQWATCLEQSVDDLMDFAAKAMTDDPPLSLSSVFFGDGELAGLGWLSATFVSQALPWLQRLLGTLKTSDSLDEESRSYLVDELKALIDVMVESEKRGACVLVASPG